MQSCNAPVVHRTAYDYAERAAGSDLFSLKKKMLNYQSLQSSIITACQETESIRALLLVGSRARNSRPIDEHADLDYLLFTPDPASVERMPGWIGSLGKIWIPDFSYTRAGNPEWMVVYEGGWKADFVFLNIEPQQTLQELLPTIPYQAVLARGFKVLLDKTASNGNLSWQPDGKDAPCYPSAAEFNAASYNFLLAATRVVRYGERGDLWRAKFACDVDLKDGLLTMIEWHARAKNGIEYDTWYDGRYLAEWADPAVVAALPETFAAYNAADLRRALRANLSLYYKMAEETAAALNLPYPAEGQEAALNWLLNFEG